MKFLREMLFLGFPFVVIVRHIRKIMGFQAPPSLRVLIYHDIPIGRLDILRRQLIWLSKRWNFVTPNDFYKIINGEIVIDKDTLLVTFDDGFYSSYEVSKKILGPLGIKAIFFVVEGFIGLENNSKNINFIVEKIIPGMPLSKVKNGMRGMEWHHLAEMIADGHEIGGHTKNHAKLSHISSQIIMREEIIGSANCIENKLNIKIKSFAYTFGDVESFSNDAMKICKEKFLYLFSGLRGDNFRIVHPMAIMRDAISIDENNWLIGMFLYGFSDYRYKNSYEKLLSWASSE